MAPNHRHGSSHASISESASSRGTRGDDGQFDIWFLEFSNAYNLNLHRPNSSLFGDQVRVSSYYDDDSFYYRLRTVYREDDVDILLRLFGKSAREIHSKWVKKPNGESDITPSLTHLPRVSTESERTSLLARLGEILKVLVPADDAITPNTKDAQEAKAQQWEKPTAILGSATGEHQRIWSHNASVSPSASYANLNRTASPPQSREAASREHCSKRPSVGGSSTSPSPKRSRGAVALAKPPSVLSRLDSGEVRSATPLPEPPMLSLARDVRSSQQHDFYGLAPSVNTSKSSFVSKVFTETEDLESHSIFPATQDTEVTHIDSSQLKLRQPSPSVVDSLAPSSSTERALIDSFNECNQNAIQLPSQNIPLNQSFSDNSTGNVDFGHRSHPTTSSHDASPSIFHDKPADDTGLVRPPLPGNYRTGNTTDMSNIKKRLQDVWPVFPVHLQNMPLAVRWEVMRVALYCGTPMEDLHFQYDPIMRDQDELRTSLRRLRCFQGKAFPEQSKPEAWKAAISEQFRTADQIVVLTASLDLNSDKVGPLFKLTLQPLKLDLPHRLDRRFGSDRFLELVMPSPHIKEIKALSNRKEHTVIDSIYNWLAESSHFLLGRSWRSFGTKQATAKKIHKEDILKPEIKTIMQERIYLFAEDGNDFLRTEVTQGVSPKLEASNAHTRMTRESLLDWLLQIQESKKNQEQSIYKLYSRITLGLSRTHPTVVLQPAQIRHRDVDIESPLKKVMNDGIARMSTALARKIRDVMGLDSIPAGYQGRFGSAKGFWIRDTEDMSDEIWIETYPSQRKWQCDFKEEDHRTFEVRNASKELRSATLNLQLLPILEDRAIDSQKMKQLVGDFMKNSLESEMQSQKEAMEDPAQFRLWVHENANSLRRQDRVRLGHLPWTAGLPSSREDQMELLLSSGFHPTKLEFLCTIAYKLQKAKCDELQSRLNVKVGRSTYAFMVIDFLGILEEDEVHLGFSSKFTDEQSGFSETFLHGMDLLVARTPAHYPSDIQRVKAVFKPELGILKDVIIFSSKGNIPLADKLSGGDYDGDIAWVCWEPSIVNNFTNAPLPTVPDLFGSNVLHKKKDTYESLTQVHRPEDVTTEFIREAFRFNLEPSLLGTCTNYKEKLCYSRNSVRDEYAIFMSTLISNLVDRAKQGIVFSEQDWNQQRKLLNSKQGDAKRAKKCIDPLPPHYKNNDWGSKESPTHIIDFVKFDVGKPTVEKELKEFYKSLENAQRYDADLCKFAEFFEKFKRPPGKRSDDAVNKKPPSWETILEELEKSIRAVAEYWINYPDKETFETRLTNTYEQWRNIVPSKKVNSRVIRSIFEESTAEVGFSYWDLLKASYCFKLYYRSQPNFPWHMAGSQLAYLKSINISRGRSAPPVSVTPEMYAGMRPDSKFVRCVKALNDGRRYEQAAEELEDVERLSDQDV
ncbi:hypothetical protein F4678DRAFT_364158 [Xylaria arbuscula]|nr:hypothetical protein F4678DRAFT_364158 [Xylaria arbuscula]